MNSISRALSELKMLDKQINKAIQDSLFATKIQGESTIVTKFKTNEEFIEKSKSQLQSIQDKINRRQKIKSAIVKSNAQTLVKIGGKSLTVAEAIERKDSIKYEKNLLIKLKSDFLRSADEVESKNVEMTEKLDHHLTAQYGIKDSQSQISSEEIKAVSDLFKKRNEWFLIAPDNMSKVIEEIEQNIDAFEAEVDYTLSESNSQTIIEIED